MAARELYKKMYSRINWQNGSESKSTALDKINLNRMDAAIDEADTRIAALDSAKAEESEMLGMVQDWKMDTATHLITVTRKNGEKTTFDLDSTYIAELRRQVQAASSSATVAKQYKNAAQTSAEAASKSEDVAVQAEKDAAGHALNARSWSDGDTGTREGEAEDCAKYYSERAQNSSDISKLYLTKVEQAADEAVSRVDEAVHANVPSFLMDFKTGHLMYSGGRFIFKLDEAGHMRWRIAV